MCHPGSRAVLPQLHKTPSSPDQRSTALQAARLTPHCLGTDHAWGLLFPPLFLSAPSSGSGSAAALPPLASSSLCSGKDTNKGLWFHPVLCAAFVLPWGRRRGLLRQCCGTRAMRGAGDTASCQAPLPARQPQLQGTGPMSCSVTALSVGRLPPPKPGIVLSSTKSSALEQEPQREIQGRQAATFAAGSAGALCVCSSIRLWPGPLPATGNSPVCTLQRAPGQPDHPSSAPTMPASLLARAALQDHVRAAAPCAGWGQHGAWGLACPAGAPGWSG